MSAHAAYVAAAYAVSALGIAALAVWILLDDRGRRQDLRRLEESGLRRRSEAAREPQ